MGIAVIYIDFTLFIFFIALSGFFSSVETALTSLDKLSAKELLKENSRKAKLLNVWLENPNRLLTAILIGNNFVNVCASITATLLAINLSDHFDIKQSLLVGIAAGLVTLIILVFGEITPKLFAKQNSKKVVLFSLKPLFILAGLLSPVIKVLVFTANLLIRMLGGKTSKYISVFTEDEIRAMIDISADEGVIEKEENKMIKEVLDFGDTIVREVMLPRISMKCIDINTPVEQVIRKVVEIGHSRIPVYRKTIDDMVGTLYARDILNAINGGKLLSIEEHMRQVKFVPETKKVMDLLNEFKKGRFHMAVVVDEYGVTSGLITMEDLLEEITGEIHDEYDIDEKVFQRTDDGAVIVLAKEGLDKVEDELGVELPSDNFDSIGGLVIDLFGRIPKKGESIAFRNLKFIIEESSRKRIIKIKIIKR